MKNITRRPASSLLRSFCGALFVPLLWSPLLQAQTVEMQDKFTYTASSIDGHAPTLALGTNVWTVLAKDNPGANISANGSEAVIFTGEETPKTGWALATYPFTPAANTLYTLTVVLNFTGLAPRDCWAGMGFSSVSKGGVASNQNKAPWMLIRPQKAAGDSSQACGNVGLTKIGDSNIPAADYAGPIVATIKWNTSSGQAQFFISGELQSTWTTTTEAPGGQHCIFVEGFRTVNAVHVKSVTLTSEVLNK